MTWPRETLESSRKASKNGVTTVTSQPFKAKNSAAAALQRFDVAVRQRVGPPFEHNVVVIAHGTVISLFVASVNPSIDAFALWRRLRCPSYVILDQQSLAFREVVEEVQVRT